MENTGSLAGEEVVELYIKSPQSEAIHSLEGFTRASLRPKERKTVRFTLEPAQTSRVTADGKRRIDPGVLQVSVGGKQSGSGVLAGTVQLTGAGKEL